MTSEFVAPLTIEPGLPGIPVGLEPQTAGKDKQQLSAGSALAAGRQLFSGVLSERIVMMAPWLAVAIGIALRISQYSFDRSLFLDEAFVATNIANRSVPELLKPLEFDQRAPAGFLICVKIATLCLGGSDMALRLAPLVSGILSVVLFCLLSRKLLPHSAAFFATLLFAVSPPLIFMASDLKQYSTDALMTIIILQSSLSLSRFELTYGGVLFSGLIGGIALWFSFPAIFVLAGVGTTLFIAVVQKKNWRQLPQLAILAAFWGVGFISLWWMQLRFFDNEPGWKKLWNDAFMPLIPDSLGDLIWILERFLHIASTPVGLSNPGLAGLAFAVGVGVLYRQSRINAIFVIAPILITLLASGFRIYPVAGRSIIFMAPLVLLLISGGLDYLRRALVSSGLSWIWAFIAIYICADTVVATKEHIVHRRMYKNTTFGDYKFEEIKPLMAYVRDHWQSGDIVYLYNQSDVAFNFYADRYGFKATDTIHGIWAGILFPSWEEIEADLKKLSGRSRVWVLFTHTWSQTQVPDRQLYQYFLNQQGACLDKLELRLPNDAAVYLYDLSKPQD